MSRSRRGSRPGHNPHRRARSYRDVEEVAPAVSTEATPRPSLLPTVLWGLGGLVFLALLVLLLAVTLPHGFPPRNARPFLGAVVLLTVLTLAFALKGLEAYLKWREARAA